MDNLELARKLMGKELPEERTEAVSPSSAAIVYMVAVTSSANGEVVLRDETENGDEWADGDFAEVSEDGMFTEDYENEEELLEDVDDSVVDMTDGDGADVEENEEAVTGFTVTAYRAMAREAYTLETEAEEDEIPGEDTYIGDEIDDGDATELPDEGAEAEEDTVPGEDMYIGEAYDDEYVLADDNLDDESDDNIEGAEVSDGYTVAECIGTIKKGDRVAVMVQDGKMVVLGVVGSGDEQEANIELVKETAKEAQEASDGKNTIFWQETEPSKEDRKENDIWFDVKNGNTLYYWNGEEWTKKVFQAQALDVSDIFAQKIVATGSITGAAFYGCEMNMGGKFIVDKNGYITATDGRIGNFYLNDYFIYSSSTCGNPGNPIIVKNKIKNGDKTELPGIEFEQTRNSLNNYTGSTARVCPGGYTTDDGYCSWDFLELSMENDELGSCKMKVLPDDVEVDNGIMAYKVIETLEKLFPLVKFKTYEKDNQTIAANAYSGIAVSVPKMDGYGRMLWSINIQNATSSGTNATYAHCFRTNLSTADETITCYIRNGSSNAAKIKVSVRVLWVRDGCWAEG